MCEFVNHKSVPSEVAIQLEVIVIMMVFIMTFDSHEDIIIFYIIIITVYKVIFIYLII